ncbi:MAG: rod shape-determining protein MreC [Parcubacteria group bacterium]|nr:rod shape-determining protein MreC [Parcubacteria group bacterium]
MNKKTKKIVFIVLGIVAVLLLNTVGGGFVKNIFYTITSPMQKVLFRVGDGVGGWFGSVFTAGILKDENHIINKQNILLQKEITQLREYKQEVEVLRKALDIKEQKGFELTMADTILYQPDDAILISAGRDMGVVSGMPAITEESVLIGKVGEVFEHFSSVILISSKDFNFDVEVYATSGEGILAIAQGVGENKLIFALAPQDKEINQGDVIRTTALGGKFPKGLLIGEVDGVRKNDAESFQEGTVIPYFTKIVLQKIFLITNFNRP